MSTYMDMTFCVNTDCNHEECERHRSHLEGIPEGTIVSIADFGGVCREYVAEMIEEIEENDGR